MRIRFAIFLMIAVICVPGWAAAEDPAPSRAGLNDLQRQEIEKLIGDYIRSHPDVILESMRNLQAREQAEEEQRQKEILSRRRDEIERDPGSPVVGNTHGDVTIVEFFDYRCPYCKSVFPSVQRLLKDDPQVRYVLKELPILSPESRIAARLALAVWKTEPKRYFELHGRLMALRGELTEQRIFEIARGVGINVERARHEMDSPEIERTLAMNNDLAHALGISGTPGFVVDDHIVPGAVELSTLKDLVAAARRTN